MSDHVEIELKFPVSDTVALRNRLRTLGATGDDEVFEDNVLLDRDDDPLQPRGEVLRLRRDRRVRLTHKAPRADERFKVRLEREIVVDDFDVALGLLGALGFTPRARYQKYRQTFTLSVCPSGCDPVAVAVTLDRLPFGIFCEIEGSRAAIVTTAELLNLPVTDAIADDYLALHQRLAAERVDLAGLTFDPSTQADAP